MEVKKSKFNAFMDCLDKIFTALIAVLYVVMISVVLTQVVARLFFPRVPPWTEEASRYLQVYLIAFSAGLAVKREEFIRVDTIYGFLSSRATSVLKILNEIVVIFLFVFLFRYSFDLYELGKPRSAVSMTSLKMCYVYFSMILASFLALCSSVLRTVQMILALKGGKG